MVTPPASLFSRVALCGLSALSPSTTSVGAAGSSNSVWNKYSLPSFFSVGVCSSVVSVVFAGSGSSNPLSNK